jgi:hypothetical protein
MTKFTRTFLLLSGIVACFLAVLFVLGSSFGGGAVFLAVGLSFLLCFIAGITAIILDV